MNVFTSKGVNLCYFQLSLKDHNSVCKFLVSDYNSHIYITVEHLYIY